MQINHVFIMCKTQLSANMMDFLIGDFQHAWRHCFDAKRRGLLFAQPACRIRADAWTVVPICCPKRTSIMICVEQNCIARFNFKVRC